MENEFFVARIEKVPFGSSEECKIYSKTAKDPRTDWANEMVQKWGMVAAVEDGEDSAGRAKLRLATPQEVVERACVCAQLLYDQFQSNGWIYEIPVPRHPDEVKAESEAEKANRK